MKKILCFFLGMTLIIPTYAITFHIEKYRWGSVSPASVAEDINWGRNTKADFDIVLDFEAKTLSVNGPKDTTIYSINDEHPTVIERYTPMHRGRSYCMADADNAHFELYLRETRGRVSQILICDMEGVFWSYTVSNDSDRIDTEYGELSAEANPYAVKSVKQSKGKRPARDIYELLSRVPGVQVLPGGKIAIRGMSSVNSGSDPLILVDGNTVNSVDNINPEEVESVNVIKDASASIYGFRGANGVISIKLK